MEAVLKNNQATCCKVRLTVNEYGIVSEGELQKSWIEEILLIACVSSEVVKTQSAYLSICFALTTILPRINRFYLIF